MDAQLIEGLRQATIANPDITEAEISAMIVDATTFNGDQALEILQTIYESLYNVTVLPAPTFEDLVHYTLYQDNFSGEIVVMHCGKAFERYERKEEIEEEIATIDISDAELLDWAKENNETYLHLVNLQEELDGL